MSSENSQTDRDAALRRMLVATASAAPAPAGRRRWGIATPIAAFALAGALTGAVSAAALVLPNVRPPASVADPVTAGNMAAFVTDDTRLFGAPVTFDGDGERTERLGVKPEDATELAVALRCVDPGQFEVLVDGAPAMTVTCVEDGSPQAGGATYASVPGTATHTLTVSAEPGDRYLVWASWAARPALPEPTSEQVAALEDGTVTRAEYEAAFDRYASCSASAGYPLGSINKAGPVITAAVSSAAVSAGVDGRCYGEEFAQVDTVWQSMQVPHPSSEDR